MVSASNWHRFITAFHKIRLLDRNCKIIVFKLLMIVSRELFFLSWIYTSGSQLSYRSSLGQFIFSCLTIQDHSLIDCTRNRNMRGHSPFYLSLHDVVLLLVSLFVFFVGGVILLCSIYLRMFHYIILTWFIFYVFLLKMSFTLVVKLAF